MSSALFSTLNSFKNIQISNCPHRYVVWCLLRAIKRNLTTRYPEIHAFYQIHIIFSSQYPEQLASTCTAESIRWLLPDTRMQWCHQFTGIIPLLWASMVAVRWPATDIKWSELKSSWGIFHGIFCNIYYTRNHLIKWHWYKILAIFMATANNLPYSFSQINAILYHGNIMRYHNAPKPCPCKPFSHIYTRDMAYQTPWCLVARPDVRPVTNTSVYSSITRFLWRDTTDNNCKHLISSYFVLHHIVGMSKLKPSMYDLDSHIKQYCIDNATYTGRTWSRIWTNPITYI